MRQYQQMKKPQLSPRSSSSSSKSSQKVFGSTPTKMQSSFLKKTKPSIVLGQVGTTVQKSQMSFRQPSVKLTALRPPRLSSPAELEWQTQTTSESNSMTEQPTGQPSAQEEAQQQPSLHRESPQQQPAETLSTPTLQKYKDPFS